MSKKYLVTKEELEYLQNVAKEATEASRAATEAASDAKDIANTAKNTADNAMVKNEYDSDGDGIVNYADNGVFTYLHNKNGTTHNLEGSGANAKFVSNGAWVPGDKLTINGKDARCFNTLGERIESEDIFGNQVIVNCTVDYVSDEDIYNVFFKYGGAALNFKIVGGTTQPTSPKENTLWVNTDMAISSWDIGIKKPTRRSITKNLLVHPYYHTTQDSLGITYTDDGFGSITAAGTSTDISTFILAHTDENAVHLKAGTYTLSGCPAESGCRIIVVDNKTSEEICRNEAGSPTTFILTSETDIQCYIQIDSGVTVTDIVFNPQIELGDTVTAFVKGNAIGQVWVVVGVNSNIVFNALKKNGIVERVITAQQWDGSKWTDLVVKGYVNGAWVDSDIYIFSATNGINRGTWTKNTDGILTVSDDMILVSAKDSSYGRAACSEGIDVTNLNKVIFNVNEFYKNDSEATYNYVGLYSQDSPSLSAYTARLQVTGTGEYVIDTSGLSGVYYAKIQAYSYYDSDGAKTRVGVNEIKFCY